MFEGRGRVEVFVERQYFVLGWISTFQRKEKLYFYGKEYTSYNQKRK